jgi:hypothetical protein
LVLTFADSYDYLELAHFVILLLNESVKSAILILTNILLLNPVWFEARRTPAGTIDSRSETPRTQSDIPASCPVTKPPEHPFVPPAPYPSKFTANGFWFGTNKLWINLRADGTWKGLPKWPDGTVRQKLFWWREGYDWHREPQPKLRVTGKRLGASASPLQSGVSHGWTSDQDHPFIVNGINLPALGCWEITGRVDDAELSFVVWVTP